MDANVECKGSEYGFQGKCEQCSTGKGTTVDVKVSEMPASLTNIIPQCPTLQEPRRRATSVQMEQSEAETGTTLAKVKL